MSLLITYMSSKENEMGIPPTPITAPAPPVATTAVKEYLPESGSPSLISTSYRESSSSSSSLKPKSIITSSSSNETPNEYVSTWVNSKRNEHKTKSPTSQTTNMQSSSSEYFSSSGNDSSWQHQLTESNLRTNKQQQTSNVDIASRTINPIASTTFEENVKSLTNQYSSHSSIQQENSNVQVCHETKLLPPSSSAGRAFAIKEKNENESKIANLEDDTAAGLHRQERSSSTKKRTFSTCSSFSNVESDSKSRRGVQSSPSYKKPIIPVDHRWDQEYYDSYGAVSPYRYGESLTRNSQKSNDATSGAGIVVPPLPPLSTGPTDIHSSQGHQQGGLQDALQFPTVRNDRMVNKRQHHQQDHQQYYHHMYPSDSGGASTTSSSMPPSAPSAPSSNSASTRNTAPHYYQAHMYLNRNKNSHHMRSIAIPNHASSSKKPTKVIMAKGATRMLQNPSHPGGTANQNTASSSARTNYGSNTGNVFEPSYLGQHQHQNHPGFNESSHHPRPMGGRHSGRERSHYHIPTSGGYPEFFAPHQQHYPTHHVGTIPYHAHSNTPTTTTTSSTSRGGINIIQGQDPSSTSNIVPPKLAPYYQRRIVPLSTEDDENWLSEFLCFVRSHCAEVFVATNEDVASRMNSKKVLLDQVGIRCRFCAHLPHRERTGRSSSFPSSLSRIYQSLTMMLRDHFTKCPAMPEHLKERYLCLKANASQGATDSKRYWVESAKSLGLVDTDEGIRYGRSCVKVPHQPPNISS